MAAVEEHTFGQRLRAVRLHAGLSQSALEGKSGIPKARLSRYENGHVLPSIATLSRLAKALGVSEASLLGDQRAIVEEFARVLFQRGIRVYGTDQAAKLAHAVADILQALTPAAEIPPVDSGPPVVTVPTAVVTDWQDTPAQEAAPV